MKWVRRIDAPIPDYTDSTGKFRIFHSHGGTSYWVLQDLRGETRREVMYADTLRYAKSEAERMLS